MGDHVNFESIKKYLPQFLSEDSQKKLFQEIDVFMSSHSLSSTSAYYSPASKTISEYCQGDGVSHLSFVNFKKLDLKKRIGLLLSNTCDMDLNNPRLYPSYVSYCPILYLDDYQKLLDGNVKNKEKIDQHIKSIKEQKSTSHFYLPSMPQVNKDGIAMLGQTQSCLRIDFDKAEQIKYFQLSDVGYYLFLLRLSIHLTRIRDNVIRS